MKYRHIYTVAPVSCFLLCDETLRNEIIRYSVSLASAMAFTGYCSLAIATRKSGSRWKNVVEKNRFKGKADPKDLMTYFHLDFETEMPDSLFDLSEL